MRQADPTCSTPSRFPIGHLCASLVMCLAGVCAHAQSTKPGLWEMTDKVGGNTKIDAAMAQTQKQMAALPPDQRKMMEEMIAKHSGSMPVANADGGTTTKVCITPEMAARDQLPTQQDGDCTTTITSRTGNTMKVKFVCNQTSTNGEGTYTFSGDKAFTVDMKVSTAYSGKPETMTIQGGGKWLSSSCGSVKPVAAPLTKGK